MFVVLGYSHYLQAFSLIFNRLSNYLFILCNLQARAQTDCSGKSMRVKSLRWQSIIAKRKHTQSIPDIGMQHLYSVALLSEWLTIEWA